ncbi:hypothetical protein EDM57_04495 [Brevibacillus gelatini]|uniref:Uncharacterized protein n=1 Tax=Brevibacillus gelatini TaxID=1655277 RepID=A0A3M8B7I9_9BACL|nr:hypothetical protein [Brevibacillus gelatini]RNB59406.1 hypothetical protein EDM57_04495 [Brevibacillus gelatini]
MKIKIINGNDWYKKEVDKEYFVIDGQKSPNGWYWVKSTSREDYAVHEDDCIVIDDDPTPKPELSFWGLQTT